MYKPAWNWKTGQTCGPPSKSSCPGGDQETLGFRVTNVGPCEVMVEALGMEGKDGTYYWVDQAFGHNLGLPEGTEFRDCETGDLIEDFPIPIGPTCLKISIPYWPGSLPGIAIVGESKDHDEMYAASISFADFDCRPQE